MTTHTQGPWNTGKVENRSIFTLEWQNQRIALAERVPGMSKAESLANARLIAAAPELLEALILAKRCLKENRGPSMDEFRMIQGAIAKAEGK